MLAVLDEDAIIVSELVQCCEDYHRRRAFFLFTGVRGRVQPVEKVVVGPVGGPSEPKNKAETLPKRRIRPPNRGPKRARRSFFNTLVNSANFACTAF
jgi:hypothetical protein